MSERHDNEEEARRETQARRGNDSSSDYEWHRVEENRLRRVSRAERDVAELAYGDSEQDLDRPWRRRSPTREQMKGLYGSRIDSNMLGSAVAEVVGTFILVFTGTAVATAATL